MRQNSIEYGEGEILERIFWVRLDLTKRSHIEREFYPPPQSEILISECDPTSLVGMEVLGLWEAGPGPGCVRAETSCEGYD